MSDQDSPWKEMLDRHLPLAMEFFFPQEVHAEVDWAGEYESLHQELRTLFPAGKRVVDCLFKVRRKGTDDPGYLHGEVQGRKDRAFPHRMHT